MEQEVELLESGQVPFEEPRMKDLRAVRGEEHLDGFETSQMVSVAAGSQGVVPQSKGGRSLYEIYDRADMWSNWCKTKCLDEEKIYCANGDMTNGYCCDVYEPCPRESYCSNDNPRAPKIF